MMRPRQRRPGRSPLRAFVLVTALASTILIAACTSGSTESAPGAASFDAASQRGAYGVGVTTLELVDTTRPTEPNRSYAGADERRLTVEVWYPAEPSDASEEQDVALDGSGAPYPLIVFAHGLGGNRRQSSSYTQHLGSHGYVVVSPDFPLSNIDAPGGARLAAVVNQPGDVSFLIDRFLDFNNEAGHLLEGAIDGQKIGVTGHSLGGLTTLLTAYGDMRDPRIGAALPIAGPGCFLTANVIGDTSVPIMVLGASEDLIVTRSSVRQAYDLANAPRYFVELLGADHTRFADVSLEDTQLLDILPDILGPDIAEDALRVSEEIRGDIEACAVETAPAGEEILPADRQRELLRAFATPFFDAYLRGTDEAKAFLEEELAGSLPEASFEFALD